MAPGTYLCGRMCVCSVCVSEYVQCVTSDAVE